MGKNQADKYWSKYKNILIVKNKKTSHLKTDSKVLVEP